MNPTDSIETLLSKASIALRDAGSESSQLDAAVLMCHVLDKPRSYLFTWPERSISSEHFVEFERILARRCAGEPVAYLTGIREFWSLPLKVAPSTLIPRPDTERLVELALEKALAVPGDILDLGTGTGAIALALASELPQAEVTGVDLQAAAVSLAQTNARDLGITNCQFFQSSWFDAIDSDRKFAVIVSNPPYIDQNDPHLLQGDVRYEPHTALVAGENGLADIIHIAGKARNYLTSGGWLLLEHGFEQGQAVRECLMGFGYCEVVTAQDYAGLDRVTMGLYKVK